MKNQSRNIPVLFAILILVGIFSFTNADSNPPLDEVDSQESSRLVQAELERKLSEFRYKILIKCKAEAIADAEIYIDSLVAQELRIQSSDTLFFPARPDRPILSKPVILNDSTDIAPIIK